MRYSGNNFCGIASKTIERLRVMELLVILRLCGVAHKKKT